MFNRFEGIGHLTSDPEMRYTGGGTPVATIRVAFNTRYRQNGELKEDTLYVDCVSFGKQAENIIKQCSKGMLVFVEGRLKMEQWEYEGKNTSI